MTDEYDRTLHRISVVLHIDLPLPPEGSETLAECWAGAKTHAIAVQHEAKWIRGEEGQGSYLQELLQCANNHIDSVTYLGPVE